jgi:hypothetical protein
MKVRIDRSKLTTFVLVNCKGEYCPLGKLVMTTKRKGWKDILEHDPQSLYDYLRSKYKDLKVSNIYWANDTETLTNDQKERHIQEVFSDAGIEVEYYGEYKNEAKTR